MSKHREELEAAMELVRANGFTMLPNQEFEELQSASNFLDCLQGAGVDNWDGYGYAQEMMEEQ